MCSIDTKSLLYIKKRKSTSLPRQRLHSLPILTQRVSVSYEIKTQFTSQLGLQQLQDMHYKDFLVTLQNMSLRSSFGLIHDAPASQKNIKSCNKQEIHLILILYLSNTNTTKDISKPQNIYQENPR